MTELYDKVVIISNVAYRSQLQSLASREVHLLTDNDLSVDKIEELMLTKWKEFEKPCYVLWIFVCGIHTLILTDQDNTCLRYGCLRPMYNAKLENVYHNRVAADDMFALIVNDTYQLLSSPAIRTGLKSTMIVMPLLPATFLSQLHLTHENQHRLQESNGKGVTVDPTNLTLITEAYEMLHKKFTRLCRESFVDAKIPIELLDTYIENMNSQVTLVKNISSLPPPSEVRWHNLMLTIIKISLSSQVLSSLSQQGLSVSDHRSQSITSLERHLSQDVSLLYDHFIVIANKSVLMKLNCVKNSLGNVSFWECDYGMSWEPIDKYVKSVCDFPRRTLFVLLSDVSIMTLKDPFQNCKEMRCSSPLYALYMVNQDDFIDSRIMKVQAIAEGLKRILQDKCHIICLPLCPSRCIMETLINQHQAHMETHSSFGIEDRPYILTGEGKHWENLTFTLALKWEKLQKSFMFDKIEEIDSRGNLYAQRRFPSIWIATSLMSSNVVFLASSEWKKYVVDILQIASTLKENAMYGKTSSMSGSERGTTSVSEFVALLENESRAEETSISSAVGNWEFLGKKPCIGVLVSNVPDFMSVDFFNDLVLHFDSAATVFKLKTDGHYFIHSYSVPFAVQLCELLDWTRIPLAKFRARAFGNQGATYGKHVPDSVLRRSFANLIEKWTVIAIETLRVGILSEIDICTFKTVACQISIPHNLEACIFYHGPSDVRRPPYLYRYSFRLCQEAKTVTSYHPEGICSQGLFCPFSNNIMEQRYHPKSYQATECIYEQKSQGCNKAACLYAHRNTPEMLYNKTWKNLLVAGVENTLPFVVGAIRGLGKLPMITGLHVMVLSPAPQVLSVMSAIVDEMARLHGCSIHFASASFAQREKCQVLLGTPEDLSQMMSMDLHDLKCFIVDDLDEILKHENNFYHFSNLINKMKNWQAMFDALNIVATYDQATSADINRVQKILKTTLHYAHFQRKRTFPQESDSSSVSMSISAVVNSLESKNESQGETRSNQLNQALPVPIPPCGLPSFLPGYFPPPVAFLPHLPCPPVQVPVSGIDPEEEAFKAQVSLEIFLQYLLYKTEVTKQVEQKYVEYKKEPEAHPSYKERQSKFFSVVTESFPGRNKKEIHDIWMSLWSTMCDNLKEEAVKNKLRDYRQKMLNPNEDTTKVAQVEPKDERHDIIPMDESDSDSDEKSDSAGKRNEQDDIKCVYDGTEKSKRGSRSKRVVSMHSPDASNAKKLRGDESKSPNESKYSTDINFTAASIKQAIANVKQIANSLTFLGPAILALVEESEALLPDTAKCLSLYQESDNKFLIRTVTKELQKKIDVAEEPEKSILFSSFKACQTLMSSDENQD